MFLWFRNRCVFGLPFSSCPVFLHRFSSDSRRSRCSCRGTFAPWVQAMTTLGGPIALMKARQSDSWVTRVTLCKILYDTFMNVMILWNPVACKAHSSKVFEYCAREAPDMAGYIFLNIVSDSIFSIRNHTQSCFFYFLFIFFKQRQRDKHMSPYALCHCFWCLMSQFSHLAIFQGRQIFGGNAYTRSGLGEKAPTWIRMDEDDEDGWWVSHVGLLEVCESIRQNQAISLISSK